MFGGFPFLGFEITRDIVSGGRGAGDGHEDVLPVWKRQAFERPEQPIFVYGFELQFNGLPVCYGAAAAASPGQRAARLRSYRPQ